MVDAWNRIRRRIVPISALFCCSNPKMKTEGNLRTDGSTVATSQLQLVLKVGEMAMRMDEQT
jgi:hypothetical protein